MYAVIEPDEDVYFVRFPDIENCFTQGDDLAHVVDMAHDVLGTMLSLYEDDGVQLPAPSKA